MTYVFWSRSDELPLHQIGDFFPKSYLPAPVLLVEGNKALSKLKEQTMFFPTTVRSLAIAATLAATGIFGGVAYRNHSNESHSVRQGQATTALSASTQQTAPPKQIDSSPRYIVLGACALKNDELSLAWCYAEKAVRKEGYSVKGLTLMDQIAAKEESQQLAKPSPATANDLLGFFQAARTPLAKEADMIKQVRMADMQSDMLTPGELAAVFQLRHRVQDRLSHLDSREKEACSSFANEQIEKARVLYTAGKGWLNDDEQRFINAVIVLNRIDPLLGKLSQDQRQTIIELCSTLKSELSKSQFNGAMQESRLIAGNNLH